MSESIDTEVLGDPGAIRSIAITFRDSVGPAVSSVGDSLVHARRDAGDTWSSDAGDAFHARVSEQITPVDELGGYMGDAAGTLDHLAGELEQCQNLMEGICRDAARAGLTVDGFVIQNPGPALPRPGPLPAEADAATAEAHRLQAEACVAQDAKLDAYTRAAHESAEVRTREQNAARSMGETVDRKQRLRLVFSGAEIGAVGGAVGQMEVRGLLHRRKVNKMLEKSRELGKRRAQTTSFEARQAISRERSELHTQAMHHRNAQWALYRDAPKVRAIGGGAFAAAGFVYDVAVLDRPWHEAAVSGGAGLGASIAAGALVGSVVPIPLVGTALGAGFGAAAGIFTSGMVDDLFETDGASVSDAVDAGRSTLADAGKSVWNTFF